MPSSPGLAARVAIVAENASFRFGGEASLPLHYFAQLRARGVEAWLIVHGRTRPELEALFPAESGRIHYIPDQWFHKLLWHLSRLLPRRVSEATFGTAMVLLNQYLQAALVRGLVAQHGVNLVHQPIPVSPKAPSLLHDLGVPVIIGPMNGGMEYPPAFRGTESAFTRVSVALGRASADWMNRLFPGKRDARILLVANQRTRMALPAGVEGTVLQLPENGVDLRIWSPPADVTAQTTDSEAPRFLFIGRLVDWKRLDLVLHALVPLPHASLEVIGDGAMRTSWANLAEQLGIASRVHFLGWLSQPACAERLRSATALVLPSVFECGGAVVLEAMATGTAVIATDWGGPAEYIDQNTGILVPATDPQAVIQGFTRAMRRLAEDPRLRHSQGTAGRAKVEALYDWSRKIDAIQDIYTKALTPLAPSVDA
jgi:glycosyltransferase involved in cell wall biosynthesis